MRFKLEFACNNAAFDPAAPEIEMARILRAAAVKLERGTSTGIVKDFNGNKVGNFMVIIENEDDIAEAAWPSVLVT